MDRVPAVAEEEPVAGRPGVPLGVRSAEPQPEPGPRLAALSAGLVTAPSGLRRNRSRLFRRLAGLFLAESELLDNRPLEPAAALARARRAVWNRAWAPRAELGRASVAQGGLWRRKRGSRVRVVLQVPEL
jgi:hypothetical protein